MTQFGTFERGSNDSLSRRDSHGYDTKALSNNREDESGALVREPFVSSGDIDPDETARTLTIRIHRMASPVNDRAVANLLEELNQQEFCQPETRAKMNL